MVLRMLFRRKPRLDLSTVVVARKDFDGSELQDSDEIVGLNPEKGTYLALNGGGSRIWRMIAEPLSVRQVCDLLQAEYAAEREELEADVFEFLESLVEINMVTVTHGQAPATDRPSR